ncbi:hypothetical protein MBLNU13_g00541t1 [Cladosporium sp. NU13]
MRKHLKTALLLTTTPAECVSFLIDRLQARGYATPILVTAPGPNAMLTDSHVEDLRSRLPSYVLGTEQAESSAWRSRPAVVFVNRSGQIEPLMAAYNPDLVLSFGFPYPLGPRLLSHRAKFVNLHAAPLPELPGPMPHIWPVLRPDLFPLDQYRVTWHYMTPGVDEGAIIMEMTIEMEQNDGITASELQKLAAMRGLSVTDEALDLVEADFEGHAQRQCDRSSQIGTPDVRRVLSDANRTITPDMSAGEIKTLFLAIGDCEWPPLINLHGGLKNRARRKELVP